MACWNDVWASAICAWAVSARASHPLSKPTAVVRSGAAGGWDGPAGGVTAPAAGMPAGLGTAVYGSGPAGSGDDNLTGSGSMRADTAGRGATNGGEAGG